MKFKIFVIILTIFSYPSLGFCEEQELKTSQDLIQHAKQWDQTVVLFKGEAIGDIMPRGEVAWVNIQDSFGVIGVVISKKMIKLITFLGDYHHKGDIIEVEGVFFRSNLELQGELCIEARNIRILGKGHKISRDINPPKRKIAFILLGITLFLVILRITIKR